MQRYEMTEANDRRIKFFCLPPSDMIRALLDQSQDPRTAPGAFVKTIAFEGLPDGYRVKHVDYLPMYQCWGVVIWHPEYPEVPLGREVPCELLAITHRRVAVEPKD